MDCVWSSYGVDMCLLGCVSQLSCRQKSLFHTTQYLKNKEKLCVANNRLLPQYAGLIFAGLSSCFSASEHVRLQDGKLIVLPRAGLITSANG